jgi:hypothetical protein
MRPLSRSLHLTGKVSARKERMAPGGNFWKFIGESFFAPNRDSAPGPA